MKARSATTALVLAGGLALSACSSGDDTAATAPPAITTTAPSSAAVASSTVAVPSITTSTTTPAAAPTSTTGATSSPAAQPAAGCAPTGGGAPATASTREVIDVDGDGRRDTGWLDGGTTFGITTASGATFSLPVSLAGGGSRTALVADTDGRGTLAALVGDGRTVELFLVRNCGLFPAQNVQGETYQFDLGFRGTGTGVGCSPVGGSGRTLVGLNQRLDDSGQSVDVTRTQVLIEGTSARNGASDTVAAPPGSASADTASGVTCGDLSMATDGVRERG